MLESIISGSIAVLSLVGMVYVMYNQYKIQNERYIKEKDGKKE